MLQEKVFAMALAESEANAYRGLYFAYECFLSRVLHARTNKWIRKTPLIGSRLRQQLGDEVFRDCWEARAIRAVQHARDAFVHRGGRADHDTVGFSDLLHIDDGYICVPAWHTRDLFSVLFKCVMQVIAAHKQRPIAADAA